MAAKPDALPVASTTRAPVATPFSTARHVAIDPPATARPAATEEPAQVPLSRPAAYEARANERNALQSQVLRLEGQLAEAVAVRDRAIARKAVDGSNEARATAEAVVGAVVRTAAELDGVRSALARLEAQVAANIEAAARNKEVARIKSAADTSTDMLTLAAEADAALAAFATSYKALAEGLAALHGLVPSEFKDAVFGGGNGLTQNLLATAAKNQLSAVAIVPRQPFPNPVTATLAAAVAHFTKPLIEEAASLQIAAVVWD